MRPGIQIKHISEYMKYLEQQIQVVEPVIEVMKHAVEKSKAWIDDPHDQPSMSYIELYQKLDSATAALLSVSTDILNNNKDLLDVEEPPSSSSQSLKQTLRAEDSSPSNTRPQLPKHFQYLAADTLTGLNTRLENLEMKISSLENTKTTIAEEKLESKRWREMFEADQQSMHMKLENLTRQQKENFKTIGKQNSCYDDKLMELKDDIDSCVEKFGKYQKDVQSFEKSLEQLKEEISCQREEPCILSSQIRRHAKLISELQKDGKKNMDTMTEELDDMYLKHEMLCQVLQQRLKPIDYLIQVFNQNSVSRTKSLKKLQILEKDVQELANDFCKIAHHQVKQIGFIATQGHIGKTWTAVFKTVEHNLGNHFKPDTGEFTAPVDGVYVVSLTVEETGESSAAARVWHKSKGKIAHYRDIQTTETSHVATKTFVASMTRGDVLWCTTGYRECEITSFSCFLVGS